MSTEFVATSPDAGPADTGRRPWFWLGVAAIVGVQLAALWHVCSEQVERAEARRAEEQSQQLAVADCLQYIPGATFHSCVGRVPATQLAQDASVAPAGATGATPVSFQFR